VVDLRRGLAVWDDLIRSFARLGAPFRRVVGESLPLFRGKNKRMLPMLLLQYRHVVSRLQMRGAWDPALGALREPPFGRLPAAPHSRPAGSGARPVPPGRAADPAVVVR